MAQIYHIGIDSVQALHELVYRQDDAMCEALRYLVI